MFFLVFLSIFVQSIELVKPSPPVPVAEVHDGHEGDKSSSEEDLRLTKPRSREPVYANVASRVFVEVFFYLLSFCSLNKPGAKSLRVINGAFLLFTLLGSP